MDIVTIISSIKGLSSDPMLVVTLIGVYFRLEKQAKKRDEALQKKNDERWDKLISALDAQNKAHEERFVKHEEKFTKIEAHVGLK